MADLALDSDPGIVRIDDLTRDGEAQASATIAARLIDPIEALEDLWQIRLGNTDAIVANHHRGHPG